MEFKTVEQDVARILKYNHEARNDDMKLYAAYAYEKIDGYGYGLGWLISVFSDRRFRAIHGIAPYETVSRVRRKLQEVNESLRPSEAAIEEKKRREKEYRNYAKRKGANNV